MFPGAFFHPSETYFSGAVRVMNEKICRTENKRSSKVTMRKHEEGNLSTALREGCLCTAT